MALAIDVSNIQGAIEVMKALATRAYFEIVVVLLTSSLTCREVHEKGPYRHGNHVETTYRALERLRKVKLLKRTYDDDRKKWYYTINEDGPLRLLP